MVTSVRGYDYRGETPGFFAFSNPTGARRPGTDRWGWEMSPTQMASLVGSSCRFVRKGQL